jgi:hypothetical protein
MALAILAAPAALVSASDVPQSIFILPVRAAAAQPGIMLLADRALMPVTAALADKFRPAVAAVAALAEYLAVPPPEVMVAGAAEASGLLAGQARLKLAVWRVPPLRTVVVVEVTLPPEAQTHLVLAAVPLVFEVVAVRAVLRGLAGRQLGAVAQCVLSVRAQPVNSPTQTCLKYISEIGRGSTAT